MSERDNNSCSSSRLFDNAIMAIEVGIEDFDKETTPRTISSVRNIHTGILLLAKEVLVRRAPGVDPRQILSANYKPTLDTEKGIRYTPSSERTINLRETVRRLKNFNVKIDNRFLRSLNYFSQVRNTIEHNYSEKPQEKIQEAIAEALPIIQYLLRTINMEPSEVLRDTWAKMLGIKQVYDQESELCQQTFVKLRSANKLPNEIKFRCPGCESALVRQKQSRNTDLADLQCTCQFCKIKYSSLKILEVTLASHFSGEIYASHTDGGPMPLGQCSECGGETMVLFKDGKMDFDDGNEWHCLHCDTVLEEDCVVCSDPLTPYTVANNRTDICSWCARH